MATESSKTEAARTESPRLEIIENRLWGKQTGEILVEMGALTHEQVKEALAEQKVSQKRIGEIALAKGWVKKSDLLQALACRLGVKFVDLSNSKIDSLAAGSSEPAGRQTLRRSAHRICRRQHHHCRDG